MSLEAITYKLTTFVTEYEGIKMRAFMTYIFTKQTRLQSLIVGYLQSSTFIGAFSKDIILF